MIEPGGPDITWWKKCKKSGIVGKPYRIGLRGAFPDIGEGEKRELFFALANGLLRTR
jgi:hypothetical protein